MNAQLMLENIKLQVNLGFSEKERAYRQQVVAQIRLYFSQLPKACENDDLNDTLCYKVLSEELQAFCDTRSFQLIEALTHQLYQFIKKKLAALQIGQACVSLRISKKPFLPQLEQSSFLIHD